MYINPISARRLKRLKKMCKELGIEFRWDDSCGWFYLTPEEIELVHSGSDWA